MIIKKENDYLTAKEIINNTNLNESREVEVDDKGTLRKYLSDLSKRNQMAFITRSDGSDDILTITRFK